MPPILPVRDNIGAPSILPLANAPAPPPANAPKPVSGKELRTVAPPEPKPLPENRATTAGQNPVVKRSGAPPAAVDAYVAPEVIGRVAPRIPADLRTMMAGAVEIEVMVTLDARGNVVNAHVTSMKGPFARLFQNEAVQAARQFQFKPARRNGQNVESQMALEFRFNKP